MDHKDDLKVLAMNEDKWKYLLSAIYAPSVPSGEITLDLRKTRQLVEKQMSSVLYGTDILSHGDKVSQVAHCIGAVLGLSDNDLFRLKIGGLLHDIGKNEIPQGVLHKPGELSAIERAVLRQHVFSGALTVSCLNDPLVTQIVFYHHEHFDGSGYLCGLNGHNIPKLARIVSVADAFAAMTTPRCYRDAFPASDAAQKIMDASGTEFDPEIVSAFSSVFMSFKDRAWVFKPESYVSFEIPRVPIHNNYPCAQNVRPSTM